MIYVSSKDFSSRIKAVITIYIDSTSFTSKNQHVVLINGAFKNENVLSCLFGHVEKRLD